jgi:hypothetical protein
MLFDNQAQAEPTPAELKARLGDMCREYQALSVKADHAWNEAIEAGISFVEGRGSPNEPDREANLTTEIVMGLKKLKRPSQAQEPIKPVSGAMDEPNPLECLHINQGSADAAADAYEAEYVERVAHTAWNNTYHKVRPEVSFSTWLITWKKALSTLSRAQQAPALDTISDDDYTDLVGALGLLRGHRYNGGADALQRLLSALFPPAAAPVSAQTPQEPKPSMRIEYQRMGCCFWHTDCTNHLGGIMQIISDAKHDTLLKCGHCGKQGRYPVGAVGEHVVDMVEEQCQSDRSALGKK